MIRNQHILGRSLLIAALASGASAASADDNGMNRFGGDSYAYFNRPPAAATVTAWRQSHPDGISYLELQALSSSGLSAAASRLDPPVFARAPADAAWREAHPNGLTEREFQALSASSLAMWQAPSRAAPGAAPSNVAQNRSRANYAF